MISSTWFKGIGKGNHASSFIAGGLGRRSMTVVRVFIVRLVTGVTKTARLRGLS
jgi:hypothetical protein